MDIRDLINDTEGRDVYPQTFNANLKSGSGSEATPVKQNLVVEVKTVTPQWSNPNGDVRPHDTPDRYDSPAIDLAPYLVSDIDGTYDNAILNLSFRTMPIHFDFIPDGASTQKNVSCDVLEFELNPKVLKGTSTVYSDDGLFRADLHYQLADTNVLEGNYDPSATSTGRIIVLYDILYTYEEKVLDSNHKVTSTIGFQASAGLVPPNLGTNRTEYPYKLRYLNFTGCSKTSASSVPAVVHQDGASAGYRTSDKFYITTLKLESEN